MSLAWATLSLVLFLLPGLAFLIGVYSHDRYSRELGKGGTISDFGLATVLALAVHLLLLGGFDLLVYEGQDIVNVLFTRTPPIEIDQFDLSPSL
jgi:hypothetical protein